MELIPHSLTPVIVVVVFGVWLGKAGWKPPCPIQLLYPHDVVARG